MTTTLIVGASQPKNTHKNTRNGRQTHANKRAIWRAPSDLRLIRFPSALATACEKASFALVCLAKIALSLALNRVLIESGQMEAANA